MDTIERILIVEDDMIFLELYKSCIESSFISPIEIFIESTVESALKKVESLNADIIILDNKLPDATAVDFLKEFLQGPCQQRPVIIMTDLDDEGIALEAMKLGATDYLIKKNISPTTLHASLINVFEKSIQKQDALKQSSMLNHLAFHDYLTGLPNRQLFEQETSKALSVAQRTESHIALFMIDLDGFKDVNDHLGHDMGDLLLKKVTQLFLSILRDTDVLARLGGDEFGLLLGEVQLPIDAGLVAQKLIDLLEKPIKLNKHQVHISTSIGIAIYPLAGKNIAKLSKSADIALYSAKKHGKNTFHFYSEIFNKEINQRKKVENNIRYYLKEKRLDVLFSQTYVSNRKNITEIEAMPIVSEGLNHGLLTKDFLALANESKLILKLGIWLIKASLERCKDYLSRNQHILLRIKIYDKQLKSENAILHIKRAVISSNISPEQIAFYVSCHSLGHNEKIKLKNLSVLTSIGCKIYIEDIFEQVFNLNLLISIPISGVILNISHLKPMTKNDKSINLICGIYQMCHTLGCSFILKNLTLDFQPLLSHFPNAKIEGEAVSNLLPINKLN